MEKPHVVILARHYPLSGGRTVFMKRLVASLADHFNFSVVSKSEEEKHIVTESIFALFKYYLRSYRELQRISKNQKIDLIIGTGLSSLGGFLFAKINKIPSLLNVSGIRSFKRKKQESGLRLVMITSASSRHFLNLNLFSRASTFIKILSDMLSLRWCTQAIVPSESSKEYIAERLGHSEKIISVNEGISPEFLQEPNTSELERLGFTGKRIIIIYPIEDIFSSSFFIEIMQRLDTQNDLVLVIGKRTIYYVDNTKQLVKTDLRVKDVFSIADVLVCTYPGLELHSTTGLEALSAGVVVLPPNLGWWRKEFGSNSILLLNALTPDEVIEKLNQFFKNKSEFEKETAQLRKKLLAIYDFESCMQFSKKIMLNLIKRQSPILGKVQHEDHELSSLGEH